MTGKPAAWDTTIDVTEPCHQCGARPMTILWDAEVRSVTVTCAAGHKRFARATPLSEEQARSPF